MTADNAERLIEDTLHAHDAWVALDRAEVFVRDDMKDELKKQRAIAFQRYMALRDRMKWELMQQSEEHTR